MTNKTLDGSKVYRWMELKVEFQRLIEFHTQSFSDIDAKAKYWLTLTLPSFVAVMGYLLQQTSQKSITILVAASALAVCLFVSTLLFSSVLLSRPVQSGVLVPKNRKIDEVDWYFEDDDRWVELCRDQVAELLSSIANNEIQNKLKARKMKRGELSLLASTPTAICLAAISTFLYSATCPSWFVATRVCACGPSASIAAGVGVAIGLITTGAYAFLYHRLSKFRVIKLGEL